jgi:large subunit ribosomal protein L3
VIAVSGTSKGKGFQGVVKRHGFKGEGSIHNQRHSKREPGSIGGGGRAGGRVVKGMKMAGRMGTDRITVKNLKVVAVDAATNTMLVKGAVPGNKDGLIEVVSQ